MKNYQITDHQLVLPDIKDFPGTDHLRAFPDNIDTSALEAKFDDAINNNNRPLFDQSMAELQQVMDQHWGPVPKECQRIFGKHLQNVNRIISEHNSVAEKKRSFNSSDIQTSTTYERLEDQGYADFHLDISEVKEVLKADIERVVNKDQTIKIGTYDRSEIFKPKSHPALFDALTRLFKSQDILTASSKYMGFKPMSITAVCLHICTPQDTHYNQTLWNSKHTSELVGMHFDPSLITMKSILYLNDVDMNSGAFGVVPESHRWVHNPTEIVFARGMSVGNYWANDSEIQEALRFPKKFRKNSIFGRMVPDGSDLNRYIKEREKFFTSDQSNVIVFDPSAVIHRGGICKVGNRYNLQILMR